MFLIHILRWLGYSPIVPPVGPILNLEVVFWRFFHFYSQLRHLWGNWCIPIFLFKFLPNYHGLLFFLSTFLPNYHGLLLMFRKSYQDNFSFCFVGCRSSLVFQLFCSFTYKLGHSGCYISFSDPQHLQSSGKQGSAAWLQGLLQSYLRGYNLVSLFSIGLRPKLSPNRVDVPQVVL